MALDTWLRTALQDNLEPLVALALIVLLLVGTLALTGFLTMRIGKRQNIACVLKVYRRPLIVKYSTSVETEQIHLGRLRCVPHYMFGSGHHNSCKCMSASLLLLQQCTVACMYHMKGISRRGPSVISVY